MEAPREIREIDFSETLPEGDRVTFREWTLDDVEVVLEACRDTRIRDWTSMPDASQEAALGWIGGQLGQRTRGEAAHFAVVERTSDSIIGNAGFVDFTWKHLRAEGGYWMLPDWREQGYATDALRLLTEIGFRDLPIERIDLFTATANVGSKRVAESAGYSYEGRLRSFRVYDDERIDLDLFSRLRSDSD